MSEEKENKFVEFEEELDNISTSVQKLKEELKAMKSEDSKPKEESRYGLPPLPAKEEEFEQPIEEPTPQIEVPPSPEPETEAPEPYNTKEDADKLDKKLNWNVAIAVFSVVVLYMLFFYEPSCDGYDTKKTNISADYKIVKLNDVSHGGATRLSIVVRANPDHSKYQLSYIIEYVTDYYKKDFDIVWITIIPNVIKPNSLDDSLKIINGNDYWLTLAHSLYVSPYKEEWNPGFDFPVDEKLGRILMSWKRTSYYYEP